MLWYILFFVVLLKIPTVYLCYVVWWAVKDPPQPGEGYAGAEDLADGGGSDHDSSWKHRVPRRPTRSGPHGSPARRPEPALARARAKPPA